MVTITVTDDEASEYLGAGQRFNLWSGGEVGDAGDFTALIVVRLCALAVYVATLSNTDLNWRYHVLR